jgi:6-phosphogluconolactonase
MYTINATTGALTATTPATIAAGLRPLSLAVDASSKFAYVANEDSFNVSMYSVGPTGAVTPIAPGTIAAARGGPTSVAVDPSGRFAYVANGDLFRGTGNVSMYSINATTGALTSIGTIVTAGAGASSVAVHPSGKFAYLTHEFSDNVSTFTVNAANGALTSIGTIAAGITPCRWPSIHPASSPM